MASVRVEHGVPPYLEDDWDEEWEFLQKRVPDSLDNVVERARKGLVQFFGPAVAQENVPDQTVLELYLES